MIADWMMACQRISSIGICLLLAGCAAEDFYEKQAQVIDRHLEAFHKDLEENRLEAALLENEEIEAIAVEVAAAIKQRGRPMATNQLDQEWRLLNKATAAAMGNRLALGQHLAGKKRYEQAIIVYERLIAGYGHIGRTCRSRAGCDLNMLNPTGREATASRVAAGP